MKPYQMHISQILKRLVFVHAADLKSNTEKTIFMLEFMNNAKAEPGTNILLKLKGYHIGIFYWQ